MNLLTTTTNMMILNSSELLMSPTIPTSPMNSANKIKKQNRARILKEKIPNINNNTIRIALKQLSLYDGDSDNDDDDELMSTLNKSMKKVIPYDYNNELIKDLKKKEKKEIKKPKQLLNIKPSLYQQQCFERRELVQQNLLNNAILTVLKVERAKENETEKMLKLKESQLKDTTAQLIKRIATFRTNRIIKKAIEFITQK